ncbi:unnamed protein product, partial [Pylaiella littoralis]
MSPNAHNNTMKYSLPPSLSLYFAACSSSREELRLPSTRVLFAFACPGFCSTVNNCCSAQRTSTAMSVRGRRGVCGRSDHGLLSEDGTANLCYACRRPGPSDNSTRRAWRHIGARECWDSLVEWEAATGGTWPHRRDLLQEPLQANECICSRVGCVSGLYSKFRKQ